jgi:hypothetical protein
LHTDGLMKFDPRGSHDDGRAENGTVIILQRCGDLWGGIIDNH